MHALRGEVLARRAHVLRRDANARAALHRARPVEAAARRDDHAAAADAEVERLVEAVAAVLEQHVLAGDAEVGGAVLHVGRHVGRAHDDERHAGALRRRGSACATCRGSSAGTMPGGGEQRQRLVEDAPLGQGDGQRRARDYRLQGGKPAILPERLRHPRFAHPPCAGRRLSQRRTGVAIVARGGPRRTSRGSRGRRRAPSARRALRRGRRRGASGSRSAASSARSSTTRSASRPGAIVPMRASRSSASRRAARREPPRAGRRQRVPAELRHLARRLHRAQHRKARAAAEVGARAPRCTGRVARARAMQRKEPLPRKLFDVGQCASAVPVSCRHCEVALVEPWMPCA